MQINARQGDHDAQKVKGHTHTHDGKHAKFLDQMPGEKPGRKHADHVPFQHQRNVAEDIVALLHGDRGGGHQQVHHAKTQCAANRRHNEQGLGNDLQRGAPTLGFGGRGHRWKLDLRQQRHGHQCRHGQRQVGAHKSHLKQVTCHRRHVGAQNRTQQAARHHQRNRLFPPVDRAQLCGGKPVQRGIGVVVTRHQGGETQQPEIFGHCSIGTQQGRQQRHDQAQLERHLAAKTGLGFGNRRGGKRAANHITHYRQSSHPAQRGHAQPHQAIDGDEDHIVGKKQALANRQKP